MTGRQPHDLVFGQYGRQRLSAWIVPAEEPCHSYDFSC